MRVLLVSLCEAADDHPGLTEVKVCVRRTEGMPWLQYIYGNLKTRMDRRDSARRGKPCDSNSSSTYHLQSSETREAGRLEDSYGPHTCYLVVVAGCCWP